MRRDATDRNQITVILGWSDLDHARAFTCSASFKDAVQSAGVMRLIEIRCLTDAG